MTLITVEQANERQQGLASRLSSIFFNQDTASLTVLIGSMAQKNMEIDGFIRNRLYKTLESSGFTANSNNSFSKSLLGKKSKEEIIADLEELATNLMLNIAVDIVVDCPVLDRLYGHRLQRLD